MKKLLLLTDALFVSAMLAAAEPVLPYLAMPPTIDGQVDAAAEWSKAGYAELKTASGKASERTLVYYGRDDRNFYAAFVCFDKNIQSLRRRHLTPEERDNAIWLDDSVELRFDPWNAPNDPAVQRQIIINANGIIYDAVGRDKTRNFNCSVQSSVQNDRWQAEISIPLRELCGYRPGGAELWRLNLARSLVRSGETQTLTGAREKTFAAPDHFLTFRSGPRTAERPFTITGLSEGKLHWRSDSAAAPEMTGTLEQLRLDGRTVGKTLHSKLPAAGQEELELKAHGDAALWRFTAPGGYVLEWDVPHQAETSQVVRFTARPLYRELWSGEKPGLIRYGTKIWSHGFDESFLPVAMEFAIPWEQGQALHIAHDSKLMLHGSQGMFHPDWDNWPAIAPPGMKFVVTPQYYRYSTVAAPAGKRGRPMLIDPAAAAQWKTDFLTNFKPFREYIFASTFGDEIAEQTEGIFLELREKHSDHKNMRQMVETIRDKHGFGKFGPPESAADPNPYRWIALRSFLHAELIRLHKEFKEQLNRELPGVFLISDDMRAGQSKVYDFADFTPEVCDIIDHQLYTSHHPLIADFSFLSKYVSDLSSVGEVWPCPHVENYGEQYTPMETLEKLSEAIRAGATGLNWYLYDSQGGRAGRCLGNDSFGAPERWLVETAVTRELGTMPPLIRPEADCALFTAMATVRAIPGITRHPHRAQMIHSLLEIPCGVFFRYCNETTLMRSPLNPERCKAVFVADAQYCPLHAFEKLEQYVQQGGKLIVTDPTAFMFTPAAEKLPRERLLGIVKMEPRGGDRLFQFGDTVLPLQKAAAWTLSPAAGAQVIAIYADGKPAAVKTAYGKGEVWFFGMDFAAAEQITSPAWQTWSRALAKALDLKLDRDIWRFRFPEQLIVPSKAVTGKCLTGNFIFFRNFQALGGANLKVDPQAKYTYSLAPDAPAEAAEVLLSQGKLTDRRRAYKSGNVDGKKATLSDRLVGWSTPDGFDITFDLVQKSELSEIKLFYQGGMRDVTVSLSDDGKDFHKAGTFAAAPDERVSLAVAEKVLAVPAAQAARFVRLSFAPAAAAKPIQTTLRRKFHVLPELKLVAALPLARANFQLFEIELWKK